VKKPQGWNGVVNLDPPQGLAPIVLPAEKDKREAILVDMFRNGFTADDCPLPTIVSVKQNIEDDFDFSVQTSAGHRDLELVEFAPLEGVRGGYDAVPDTLNVGRIADRLTGLVMKKADHYAGYSGPGLTLLVYSTHYAFQPLDDVFQLSAQRLRRAKPLFERVCFLIPTFPKGSAIYTVFPISSPELTPEEVRTRRKRWFANADFRTLYRQSTSDDC
jgi:hypothetical protein